MINVARNTAQAQVTGEEVCWLDTDALHDLSETEFGLESYAGNYEDPRQAFAIDGHEVKLADELSPLLEDERQFYIY